MKHLNQNRLVIALSTLLTSGGVFAQDLQQEVSILQQQLTSLQQRIAEAEGESPHSSASVLNEEALSDTHEVETSPRYQLATTDEIEGVRSELENYKYDQSRQYERQTVKSARDTTLYGTVQVRAQAQDHSIAQSAKSSFDVATALIGVRGNLYKDYNEGKNLDYQLSYGYSKRNDGTNNSNFNLLDAFLRYHVLSTNSGLETEKLNVTIGQQLLPFGLDVQSPEDLRPTITYAAAASSLGNGWA